MLEIALIGLAIGGFYLYHHGAKGSDAERIAIRNNWAKDGVPRRFRAAAEAGWAQSDRLAAWSNSLSIRSLDRT